MAAAPADRDLRYRSRLNLIGVLVALLISSARAVTPVAILARLGNRAVCKQAGKIVGVYCIAQEERPGYVEDFLHGAQIGRVREEHVTGKRRAAHIRVSIGRNDDFTKGVGQVVRVVAGDAVGLGLVPPDDDCAVVPVGPGGHDHGNYLLQEAVALEDVGRVTSHALEAARERGVLIVELIGRYKVVLRQAIAGQIDEKLLQWSILQAQRIVGREVITAVAVSEISLRIVLDGVIELLGAVELVDAIDKDSGEALDRRRPLILGQNDVVEGSSVRDQVNVFLIRLPANSAAVKETRKVQLVILVAERPRATCRGKGIIVIENAKIRAGFRPEIIGLRGVYVGVFPSVSSQNVAIVRGEGRLFTDIHLAAVDDGSRGPAHKAVDEGRVGILKNLLDWAGKLIGRLSPIVVFHGDHENRFNSVFAIFRAGGQLAHRE